MTPLANMHVEVALTPPSRTAVRLGLNRISGLSQAVAERIARARAERAFDSVEDLARRARLDAGDLRRLASADALQSLAGHRRQQVWDAAALRTMPALLQDTRFNEERLLLQEAPEGEEIVFDYASTGLTLRSHPLALLRPLLQRHRYASSQALRDTADGRFVRTCGIVTVRQQPETAKGTIFVSLEDEAGAVNVIIWKGLRIKQRQAVLQSRLMAVKGLWQSKNGVQHLVAQHVEDRSEWLGRLSTESRDFR
jgi:error-prone DNA polymerase